ncbi:P pilus assembly protein, chaperone PapD [Pseudomonas sp. NFACC02]|uniref:fimbrial biogenesis chaperone n=1 Tax=Pseudomonas sp. NFACC02 TaxID=1566250 RepID=UPI0008D893BC|nr:molecular chaperone [Pseudomonas sp. NFACC02]SER56380.1 P pilus assembly protein, chaperone PapD [Pseudomonas sp. NFACC02]
MKWGCLPWAMFAFFSTAVDAAVSLSGTRLVFDGRFREASIEVSNSGTASVLVQAWLGKPDGVPSAASDLPFVVTPPLAQLPAQGKQMLRLFYEGVGMPEDRESLLHLYVLEVPRRSEAAQQLSIAIRHRINVFYRPDSLPGDPAEAAQNLIWQRSASADRTLWVRNPTPFHVSLQDVVFEGGEVSDYLLIEPLSERSLSRPSAPNSRATPGRLTFKALTDYGGQRTFCAHARGDAPFNAHLRPAGAESPAAPAANSTMEKC